MKTIIDINQSHFVTDILSVTFILHQIKLIKKLVRKTFVQSHFIAVLYRLKTVKAQNSSIFFKQDQNQRSEEEKAPNIRLSQKNLAYNHLNFITIEPTTNGITRSKKHCFEGYRVTDFGSPLFRHSRYISV